MREGLSDETGASIPLHLPTILAELHRTATNADFAEWMRTAVQQFVENYDDFESICHSLVLRNHRDVYEDWCARHFPCDEEPLWVGASPADVEAAMQKCLEGESLFQEAAAWSKDGSRCLSCGRDWKGKLIDLATVTDIARRTLVALYLMARGDSTLLFPATPVGDARENIDDTIKSKLNSLVSEYDSPNDPRFERIALLMDSVLSHWNRLHPETKCEHTKNFECVNWFETLYTFTDSQSVVIRELWNAWEAGTPWLREETLLEAIDEACVVQDKSRLRDVFRSNGKNHPAWDTMIVAESKNNKKKLFGLAVPKKSS